MAKFVIDMMGGDLGPAPLIEAILIYLKKRSDVEFICVGKKEELTKLENVERVSIVDARDVIKMEDDPMTAIKKKESSMMKAFKIYKEIGADAIVSCGGTGAYLTGATLLLKRLKGIKRPALVAPFPSVIKSKYVTILDIGANNVNTAEELHQFAMMGNIYSNVVFGVESPKVSLLANGTEDHKGTPVIQEANKLLREDKSINFLGNYEPRNVLSGERDVIVCDGFSGNVLLKSTEGVFQCVSKLLKEGFKKNIFTMYGYLFSRSVVNNIKDTFNYKKVGGAMLLGIDGVVVKGHGNSDVEIMLGALNVAQKMVDNNIVERIRGQLKVNEQ